MAVKRKIDVDADDVLPCNKKQFLETQLIPFPNSNYDDDVLMSDPEPSHLGIYHYHTRSSSNISSTSSSSTSSFDSSPVYPTFDIYPMPFFNSSGTVNPNSHSYAHYASQSPTSPVGLLQPFDSFAHHGADCSQVPKLRVACSPGLNGQRTMWSFCEQCGACSMVRSHNND